MDNIPKEKLELIIDEIINAPLDEINDIFDKHRNKNGLQLFNQLMKSSSLPNSYKLIMLSRLQKNSILVVVHYQDFELLKYIIDNHKITNDSINMLLNETTIETIDIIYKTLGYISECGFDFKSYIHDGDDIEHVKDYSSFFTKVIIDFGITLSDICLCGLKSSDLKTLIEHNIYTPNELCTKFLRNIDDMNFRNAGISFLEKLQFFASYDCDIAKLLKEIHL